MRFRRDGRHFATAIKVWFCSLKKGSQIALSVGLVHLGAILWMSMDHWLSDHPKPHHPIVVRTVRPQMAPIHVASAPTPQIVAAPRDSLPIAPRMNIQKTTKQTTTKPAKEKPILPSKSVKIASERSYTAPVKQKSIPKETLRQIEEEFEAISAQQISRKTTSEEIRLPAQLQSKTAINASIEENISSTSIPSTYHLCLIDQLQSSLQLPEVGSVRVKIVLFSPGTLSSIQILDTKSEKNAQWLKNQLPLLSLPCFNDFGIVDAFLEFTITFCNAENF